MSHGHHIDHARLKYSINLSIARPENSIDSEGTNVSHFAFPRYFPEIDIPFQMKKLIEKLKCVSFSNKNIL